MKLEILDGTIRFRCPYCDAVLERTIESLRSGVVRYCDTMGRQFKIRFRLEYQEVEGVEK